MAGNERVLTATTPSPKSTVKLLLYEIAPVCQVSLLPKGSGERKGRAPSLLTPYVPAGTIIVAIAEGVCLWTKWKSAGCCAG